MRENIYNILALEFTTNSYLGQKKCQIIFRFLLCTLALKVGSKRIKYTLNCVLIYDEENCCNHSRKTP